VLENARVLAGTRVLAGASVKIDDGVVTRVGDIDPAITVNRQRLDLEGRRLVPGFVDIQVNGGGGVLFNNNPTLEGLRTISQAHIKYGTTSLLPTLISDDLLTMRQAVAAVREAIDNGEAGVLGIHFEGPFLNAERKGAHDPEKFRTLDDEALGLLTSLGEDAVTLVTLAPERVSPEQISTLVGAGVVVFAGHTAASYEDCRVAERAGLTGYTHLFNAMAPLMARQPGVVGAAIESATAAFSIIADGLHVHPACVSMACRAKAHGLALLVTDAMPTVGTEEKSFVLNGERITRVGDELRNAAGSLAGSNLTMIDAVRNAMAYIGIPWDEAIQMATAYPSRAIGREKWLGRIAEGARADLVELNDDDSISRVWQCGRLVFKHEHRAHS
jgi:N-acetylglucosamine-6-phosphate deacetylase